MKRLIYIDTSEFVAANFDFSGSRFRTVVSRVEAGQISIGMPKITRQEIISQIDKALQEADKAIAKARRGARILRNLDDDFSKSLFRDFDRAKHRELLIAQLDKFLSSAKAVTLNFDGVDAAAVFDLYFAKQAPFGDGKKKAEFPDAFTLSILSIWAEDEQQDVLISSSDADVKAGTDSFTPLQHVGTLEQLLARIALEFDQLAPAAETALQALAGTIEEDLCNQFEELGFILDDQEGEVIETRALEASFEASLLYVDGLGDDYGEATFDLVGTVHFEADLSYDDMDTAMYDHEDQRHYAFNTIDETVERVDVFQATVTIMFSLSKADDCEFKVIWNSPKDISVTSIDGYEWPYK